MDNELFETMPVPRAYLKLAVPVVLSMVVTLVYNIADTYFISRTGNTPLIAGVSLCAPLFTFLLAMGDIFGIGGSSLISRLLGEQKTDEARKASVLCFYGSILAGILITATLIVLTPMFLKLMGADPQTMPYASAYFRIVAMASPLVIFSLVPVNLLRTEGHASLSMVGSVIGSIVNIILDPIFITSFGWGAAGAAWATLAGYVCSVLFFIWVLTAKSRVLSLNIKLLSPDFKRIKDILSIGLPSSTTNLASAIGVMLLNQSLLVYGNDKIAAMGVTSKIGMIVLLVMVGMAFGGQPLVGYCTGARNWTRLKKTIRFAYGLQMAIALTLSITVFIGADGLTKIFLSDPTVQETARTMLRVQMTGMPFAGIVLVTTCVFQAAGKGLPVLVLSAGRQRFVFAAVVLILSRISGYTGVIWSQPVADLLTAAIAICFYIQWVRSLAPQMKLETAQ